MRRGLALLVATLAAAGVAHAGWSPYVVKFPRPAFPPPLRAEPNGRGALVALSTTPRAPTYSPRPKLDPPPEAPATLAGGARALVFGQSGTTFVVYGTGVIAGFGPRGGMKYAFDLQSFGLPPRSLVPRAYGPQEISWARQIGRMLVVQTNHLGYASDSGGRNGYLNGIDLETGKVRWRSPALVANAQNFVVTRGLIVSGYGFTKEKDWLYLVDPATGKVRDRLALPSAAERITVSGDRIVVRCYDARVVARFAPA